MSEKIAYIIKPGYQDFNKEQEVLAPLGYKVEMLNWNNDIDVLRKAIEKADLLFVRDTVLDKTTINHMHSVKGIIRYGVGIDTIDIEAATEKGIVVTRIPNYGADIEVADHTLALILGVKRRLLSRDKMVRDGAWNIAQQEPMHRIAGSTLGLLGYGKIARAVANRMRAFGVEDIIAYDPFIDAKSITANEVELLSLNELAKRSDILSLHAPATKDNINIIDGKFLTKMKPNSVIINTSRGGLIDEEALYDVLRGNKIFGAGLDVFHQEPPQDNPLFELDNVIVSDHTGWYSQSSVETMQSIAAEQAKQIITTGTATNRVN